MYICFHFLHDSLATQLCVPVEFIINALQQKTLTAVTCMLQYKFCAHPLPPQEV